MKAFNKLLFGLLIFSLLFALSACSPTTSNTDTQTADTSPVEVQKDKKADFLALLDDYFEDVAPSADAEDAAEFEWFKNDFTDRLLRRTIYNYPQEKQEKIYEEESYIMCARSLSLVKEPSIHFGDAFDYFFDKARWEYFEGTRDGSDEVVRVVEFTGDFLYNNEHASALIQFEVDDDYHCEYSYYSRNGNPETMNSLGYLVDDVIETYKLYLNKATPAN